jgi:hypothetical protein
MIRKPIVAVSSRMDGIGRAWHNAAVDLSFVARILTLEKMVVGDSDKDKKEMSSISVQQTASVTKIPLRLPLAIT